MLLLVVIPHKVWSITEMETSTDSTKNAKQFIACKVAEKMVSHSYQTLISPLEWKGKQWITFGAVVSSGVIIYTQDKKVQRYFSKHQNGTLSNLSKYGIEPLGSGLYTSVILGGLYVGGRLSSNSRLSATSLTAVESFVISSLFTQVLKHTFHRHRPFQDALPQPNRFEGPFKGFDYTSFPSGHSTAAFGVASVFAFEYRKTIWVPILAYGLASSVAISRVYDNRHWASDVLIGSSIGIYTGYMIHKLNKVKPAKVQIVPQFGNNFSTLALYYTF